MRRTRGGSLPNPARGVSGRHDQDCRLFPVTGHDGEARRTLERLVVLFALALLLGPLINARIGIPGLLKAGPGTNTFFVQYRQHEPIFLGLLAAFLIGRRA